MCFVSRNRQTKAEIAVNHIAKRGKLIIYCMLFAEIHLIEQELNIFLLFYIYNIELDLETELMSTKRQWHKETHRYFFVNQKFMILLVIFVDFMQLSYVRVGLNALCSSFQPPSSWGGLVIIQDATK